ncbi:MAG TPA: LLM class flavin-dependent oxidoreductase [Chloroflexota bacterium]|nr:LLM class flavin-dependent oxidoreductase [Chloroflexota bacterium]
MIHIGLTIPTSAPDAEARTAIEFGRSAEMAGLDSVWVSDRLVFPNQDPLVTLAAVAATTTRIGLGTCVLLGALRRPALLAKMVASIDRLSGGRVILGLGAGSRPDDFAAGEIPFEHRGSRLEEDVRLLRAIWSGDEVRHAGNFHQIDVGAIGPRPAQSHIPIWFGGGADSALKRIVRVGDGYIGSSSSGPAGFRANWDKIRRFAEAAGRDIGEITPAALVYACVDDDRERAEAKALAYRMNYYGTRRMDTTGFLLGSADDCVRGAHEYFEAGVQTMIVGSLTADLTSLDRFCEQVLPRLRA